MPAVEIIESSGRNAYASGFHPSNSAIGVSRGLLQALNDAELEAVLAHEVSHIETRDNRLMTLANLCSGAVSTAGQKVVNTAKQHPIQSIFLCGTVFLMGSPARMALFVGLVLLVWGIAELLRLTISQKREFIADARAIEIMKSPAALISALRKVPQNDAIEGLDPKLQAMMISNLSGSEEGTHPTINARIRAIEETTTVNYADIAAVSNGARHGCKSHMTGDAISKANPGFGKRRNSGNVPTSADSLYGRGPQLENEKLEITYQTLTAAGEHANKVSNGLTKFLIFGPLTGLLIGPILAILVIIVVVIGVPGAILLRLALGSYLWQWHFCKQKAE